ncbi:MAG: beta-lactamase family protein [Chloroflexi bacterium]|nr:beta-lactamase family protein [Chloroflexota bacterium]
MEDWPRALDPILEAGLDRVYTAAVVEVRHRGWPVYQRAVGHPDPEAAPERPATLATLFDLASITKPFVATAFLRLLAEMPDLTLTTPVAEVLPEFWGPRPVRGFAALARPSALERSLWEGIARAEEVTFAQVLSHAAGLAAWLPLYTWLREEVRPRVLRAAFAYKPGRYVLYSDIGFIILGWVVEALTAQSLDRALQALVLTPLGLTATGYRRRGHAAPIAAGEVAATEYCPWRGRRIRGEVHDEKAWYLEGVAGHAGVFSTARDVAAFGQAWLDALRGQGPLAALLGADLPWQAVQLQAQAGLVRRGLGWALWSPAPRSVSNPLGPRAFGHTGFTGTSLFVDPDCDIVIAALTNRVYFGRERTATAITDWRLALHREAKRLCSSLG